MIALLTFALVAANPHLPVARDQVRTLDEKTALKTLDKAMAFPDTTSEELAQIWLYIGLAHAGLIHEKEARAAFRTALVIDPNLELPAGINPAWQEWWRQAKVERPPPPPLDPKPVVEAPPLQLLPPPPPPPPPPEGTPAWRTGLGIGLVSASVIAIAAGAFVGVQARALSQKTAGEPITQALSLQRDAEARATTANVLYGAGAGLMLGGGLVFFWP